MIEYTFKPIGIIRSSHFESCQTPIQPVFAKGIHGTVEVFSEYADGLMDIEKFSHIYLFYYFNRAKETKLKVKPYLEDELHGIFATRSPHRPNKIGISVVKLLKIEKNILFVEDVDILDGTPLLDIKPYIARFDSRDNVRSGWQDEIQDDTANLRGKKDYKE